MAAFSDLGYESFGIEPSAAGREAPPALASRIEQCYFGDESLAEPVDLSTAFHVLEHVSDPEAFLNRCHSRLNEQGILVIEVPSFEFARKRLNDDPVTCPH
jgi:predicted SAM-dependent methyltransferase